MNGYWERRPDLDAEVQSLMQSSEFTVYYDAPHGCIHIMRGDHEFSSALYPMDDAIRSDLRQQAYLLHNGMDADERQRIKEANEKMEAYGDQQRKEAESDVHDYAVWEYKNRFIAPQNTPMFIVPGRQE